ncbi:MAG TPA: flagellar protein FlgN [Acidimicrobiales bacterium]|nr:flagellar protein FlgN [Acidimicrobiales bacterium]
MGLDDLSVCLWEQRAALEHLAFRLEEELLVLAAGRHRWLSRTLSEVNEAYAALDASEQRRAEAAKALAAELGLPPHATLSNLADATGAEEGETLRRHRTTLRQLLETVQELTERASELLARNLSATADALAMLGIPPTSGYRPGGAEPLASRARLIDARA